MTKAERALNAEPKYRSVTAAITAEARILARLQNKLRALRKDQKETERQIKVTRQNLKRLIGDTPSNREQAPPLKAFGES